MLVSTSAELGFTLSLPKSSDRGQCMAGYASTGSPADQLDIPSSPRHESEHVFWSAVLLANAPAPMLAHLEYRLPRGDTWRYEPKFDGFRGLLWHHARGHVQLLSGASRKFRYL